MEEVNRETEARSKKNEEFQWQARKTNRNRSESFQKNEQKPKNERSFQKPKRGVFSGKQEKRTNHQRQLFNGYFNFENL